MPTISALVEGGKASAGPPLGPALGPLGVNISEVIAKINEETKNFEGIQVPVKVSVDPGTKTFEVEVGSPPTTALLKKYTNAKGASNPKTDQTGSLSMDQVIEIALKKAKNKNFKEIKGTVKQVIGTCNSMGITVEGKKPKPIAKKVTAGEFDQAIETALKAQ